MNRRANAFAIICVLAFLAMGWSLLPYPGLEADEVLFACPLYAPYAWTGRIRMFHTDLPTMVMNYIGTLKTSLYAVIFHSFNPTDITVRLPMLLLTAVTIWIVYRLLLRTAGVRAALAACIILATDPVFLMTALFDWGPVAIQHFLIAAAMLLLVIFHQRASYPALAAAAFTLGLGLWDKVSFAWLLVALILAGAITFNREIRTHFAPKPLAIAFIAFVAGALPLLIFNYQHHAATLHVGAGINSTEFEGKYESFRDVLRGSGLYGYLSAEDPTQPGRQPGTAIERLSVAVHNAIGHSAGNLGAIAFILAAALAMIRWRSSRALRFSLLFVLVAWLSMLLVKGAGGSVHHTILLWPGVPMLIGFAIAEISNHAGKRAQWTAISLSAALVAGNILIYNEYLYSFVRYGSRAAWSSAINPLADSLLTQHPTRVCLADWGMINQLRILGHGTLAIDDVSFTLLSFTGSPSDNDSLRQCAADSVIVTHTPPLEEFKGARQRLDRWASAHGFEPTPIATITDELDRPVFVTFRYTPHATAKIQ